MIPVLPFLLDTGTALSGILAYTATSRLMQRWIPSNADQAAWANIEERRNELRSLENRFFLQMAETRKLKMDELEQSFINQQIIRDDTFRIQRWPLALLPMDMLRRSQASNGRALNIIIKPIEVGDEPIPTEPAEIKKDSIGIITTPLIIAIENLNARFKGNLLCYADHTKSSKIVAENLRTALWSFLQTEPVVLIEIHTVKSGLYSFVISHWGNAFDSNETPIVLKPFLIDLSGNGASAEAREGALRIALSSLIVSLADAFRVLHLPHELYPPILPNIIREVGSETEADVWQPTIKAHLALYNVVASRSPLIASELAAKAALAAFDAKQDGFARNLLDKSIEVHPLLKNANMPSDQRFNTVVRGQREKRGKASELERALIAIQGWSPGDPPKDNIEGRIREWD